MAQFVRKSMAKMNVQDIDLYINEINIAELEAKKKFLFYKEANKGKAESYIHVSVPFTKWRAIVSELNRAMRRREYLISETNKVTKIVRKYCKPSKMLTTAVVGYHEHTNGYKITTLSGVKVSIDLIGSEEVDAVSDIQKDLRDAGFKVSDVEVYDNLFTKHVSFFTEVQK